MKMNYRDFGKTGWALSEIVFGACASGGGWGEQSDKEALAALHRAIDLGINFIDTAAGYGDGHSERVIGEVLKERSEDVIVATKTPVTGVGSWPPSPYCRSSVRYPEAYLRENVEERLRCLGIDSLDLLQLHTWTRALNRDPEPLLILRELKAEGKIRAVGISTPEHDQNSVIDLMRAGLVDSVQVIYNIFEQEPAAELLPVAKETGTAIIVRVAFDEGVLTGKYSTDWKFPEEDFRSDYFAGDRLGRAVQRVRHLESELAEIDGHTLTTPETALKFVLDHEAVSTVIPGIRNVYQAERNAAVSSLPEISEAAKEVCRNHRWNRGFWYGGK